MHFFLFYNLSNTCHNTLEGIRRAGIGRAELYLHLDIALVASSLFYFFKVLGVICDMPSPMEMLLCELQCSNILPRRTLCAMYP